MPLTIPQTQNILQSYFATGDMPTQNQFLELIGTIFYLYNDMVTQAAAAATAANSAIAIANTNPPVLGLLVYGSGFTLVAGSRGIASIVDNTIFTSGHVIGSVQVNFTAAFANANYKVLALGFDTYTPAAGNIILFPKANTAGSYIMSLAIFP